ncbi:hypothetical protein GCM10009531_40280 [Actinoplanes capillaceus]
MRPHLDRWAATADLVMSLPTAVTHGVLPERLAGDITALRDGRPPDPRVILLCRDAGDGDPVAAALRDGTAGTAVRPEFGVTVAPPLHDTAGCELVRAAILDADVVLAVVRYTDVVSSPGAGIAPLAPWTALALEVVGPHRLTVVVDGIEDSRSTASNRRDWVARSVRRGLLLGERVPDRAIAEVGTRAGTGLAGLLERALGGWLRDAERAAVDAVGCRLARTVTDLRHWCHTILDGGTRTAATGAALDPARVLDPGYARERETRLLARGTLVLLDAADRRLTAV